MAVMQVSVSAVKKRKHDEGWRVRMLIRRGGQGQPLRGSDTETWRRGRGRRNEPDCWRTGKKAGRRAGAESRREVQAGGGLQAPDPHGGSL